MYFTREKNETKEAVYSGRFAFIPCIESDSLKDSKLYEDYNSALSSGKIYNGISEEFYHSRQVSRSLTGLSLNGFRWFCRVYWLVTNKRYFVRKYYLLRSIFYCFAYDALEQDAAKKEHDENSIEPLKEIAHDSSGHSSFKNIKPITYTETEADLSRDSEHLPLKSKKSLPLLYIAKIDFLILSEWIRNINLLFIVFYISLLPVTILVGFVITKHFTISVNRMDSHGNLFTHLVSNQIYISNITESKERTELSWRIGTYIQPEYWAIRLRGDVCFEDWIMEKFSSEFYFYRNLYEKILSRNEKRGINMKLFSLRYGSYEKYVYDMVDFSIMCSCMQKTEEINLPYFSYKVKKMLTISENDLTHMTVNKKAWLKSPNYEELSVFNILKNRYLAVSDNEFKNKFDAVIMFFYLHGN